MSYEHLVFFDGQCAFCNRAVRFIAEKDDGLFAFAPLQGKTAKEVFETPPSLDTLVLVEHQKPPLYYGKAALRILWHLGGAYRLLGFFSFLPTFLADALYRLIAKNRHLFGKVEGSLEDLGERILP